MSRIRNPIPAAKGSALLILLAASGCERLRSEPDTKADAVAESAAPRLEVDLPAGIDVSVDGQAHGTTPIDGIEVAPGPHAIALTTACGTIDLAAFEVSASGTTRLVHRDVADLKVARLRIAARKLDGSAVTPTVTINDRVVALDNEGEAEIPACRLRLHISADGIGAFQEDIEAEAGKTYVRAVTLAPGPTMVRIHGGPFTIGPPGPARYDPEVEYTPDYYDLGDTRIDSHDVTISTFDLDATEVTAEQYAACRAAAKPRAGGTDRRCNSDEECEAMGGCPENVPRLLATAAPAQRSLGLCNAELNDPMYTPRPGREKHPANCLARWQAEAYCKWVGKRLPTDIEHEYASRSRRKKYVCPWGGDMSTLSCNRDLADAGLGTSAVCSAPRDGSEQGVCDLVANANEFVTWIDLPSRKLPADAASFCRGPEHGVAFGVHPYCLPDTRHPKNGFRCARTVDDAAP